MLIAVSSLLSTIQCISVLCNHALYGVPALSDATTVAQTLPFVKLDPDHQLDATRMFGEPSFFTPKFNGQINLWGTKMVQLPRMWRFSRYILHLFLGIALRDINLSGST